MRRIRHEDAFFREQERLSPSWGHGQLRQNKNLHTPWTLRTGPVFTDARYHGFGYLEEDGFVFA